MKTVSSTESCVSGGVLYGERAPTGPREESAVRTSSFRVVPVSKIVVRSDVLLLARTSLASLLEIG